MVVEDMAEVEAEDMSTRTGSFHQSVENLNKDHLILIFSTSGTFVWTAGQVMEAGGSLEQILRSLHVGSQTHRRCFQLPRKSTSCRSSAKL